MRILVTTNQRPLTLAKHHALQRARFEDTEYDDGQFLIAAQRQCGRIHNLEILLIASSKLRL